MKSNTKPKADSPWQTVSENLVRYKPSGTYFSYFRRNGKPPVRKSLKTGDIATARRILAQRKAEAEKPKLESIEVKEVCARYLKDIVKKSASTQLRAKILCDKMKAKFGNVEIAKLEIRHIEDFLNERISNGGKKSSYNEDLRDAKKLFDLAVRDKYLSENPIANLKQMKRDDPNRDTPSEEQFLAILESVRIQKDHRHAEDSVRFIKFMGLAGIGNSEAAALKWKHVDFQNELIRLYRNKTKTEYTIPIFPSVKPMLEGLFAESDKLPESNVFKIQNARKALTNACKRLQLPHFTQRSLRRMFITKCIYLNIPAPVIGSWQGHQDNGATILKNYAQVINGLNNKLSKLVV